MSSRRRRKWRNDAKSESGIESASFTVLSWCGRRQYTPSSHRSGASRHRNRFVIQVPATAVLSSPARSMQTCRAALTAPMASPVSAFAAPGKPGLPAEGPSDLPFSAVIVPNSRYSSCRPGCWPAAGVARKCRRQREACWVAVAAAGLPPAASDCGLAVAGSLLSTASLLKIFCSAHRCSAIAVRRERSPW